MRPRQNVVFINYEVRNTVSHSSIKNIIWFQPHLTRETAMFSNGKIKCLLEQKPSSSMSMPEWAGLLQPGPRDVGGGRGPGRPAWELPSRGHGWSLGWTNIPKWWVGIDTAFAMLYYTPTRHLGVLVQPSGHNWALGWAHGWWYGWHFCYMW